MSTAALVKQSDLNRMATIALRRGVRVEIEIGGKLIRVAPDTPVPPPLTTPSIQLAQPVEFEF